MIRVFGSLILPVVLACSTNAATPAAPLPDRSAFLSLHRELVETNTTYSAGDCTRAAKQLESRFREGGFTESELTLYVPADRPRDGGLVVTWNGRSPRRAASTATSACHMRDPLMVPDTWTL
jgi:hypothetical protein